MAGATLKAGLSKARVSSDRITRSRHPSIRISARPVVQTSTMLFLSLCLLLVSALAAEEDSDTPSCTAVKAVIEAIAAEVEEFEGMCDPVCKEDGLFADVQCCGSECFCSTEFGDQILNYTVPRSEAEGMTCNCAKEDKSIRDSGTLGRSVYCEENGDYQPVQCVGSVCHCVDIKTGEKVGSKEAPIHEELTC